MSKLFLTVALHLIYFSTTAQKVIPIKLDVLSPYYSIKQTDSITYSFPLQKDKYYSIVVQQKGIDLAIVLKDKNGKTIREMDTPNGKVGPEKIVFTPDSNAMFMLTIKPFIDVAEADNAKEGMYSIQVKQPSPLLKKYTKAALVSDLEMLKNAYIETHMGLWYNSYGQMDSIYNVQKNKIKDGMNGWEFYQIAAPLAAFTKEGHVNINKSDEMTDYFYEYGKHFPFFVKILSGKVYILNDLDNYKTKGMLLNKINGIEIDTVLKLFMSIEPSDGFNKTSKYGWIGNAFAKYVQLFLGNTRTFNIEVVNPTNNETVKCDKIRAYTTKERRKQYGEFVTSFKNYEVKAPSLFNVDTTKSTATLTINTFDASRYNGGRKGFKLFLDSSFNAIYTSNIKNLIIDIRRNEGGNQGMEDHLMAYLIDKAYPIKYKSVEIPCFEYSFLNITNYKNEADILKKELSRNFYQANDGRFMFYEKLYKGDSAKTNSFKGNLYMLVSGYTFSGGSEFAALAKNYTNAIFIGEETGGGYYGNTSGTFIEYILPNTMLQGRIPLEKFVLQTTKNSMPFGSGLLPDYFVQPTIEEYINHIDSELNFTRKLIDKK
jgi:Peptidase family S41